MLSQGFAVMRGLVSFLSLRPCLRISKGMCVHVRTREKKAVAKNKAKNIGHRDPQEAVFEKKREKS